MCREKPEDPGLSEVGGGSDVQSLLPRNYLANARESTVNSSTAVRLLAESRIRRSVPA